MDLATFNESPDGAATGLLLSCCASRRFAAAVARGRPYPSLAAVNAAADAAFKELTWDDVSEAVAAHPRIGARATGQSAAEQSGVRPSDRAALAAANAEYEARFGHAFLICATGLSGTDMLAALKSRLANNPYTERALVTQELRKITADRVRKALDAA
ncbi:MAG TPA: 2-oxo-4-hydroxy-4-carboxy-5-ureidoimidazoline decarboxylase [Trebonia sp.]|nr:2-oxo-4-hydroxy-4-carboxy-5-ureidoimidazoline decarboxylase [Trebonia sp.]